ncbi:MAG TPA: DUF2851 family protein, partial [Flavobacterium sp.]|nr:DUF2851 family protein [Flavobacterium sp.]
MKEDFLHYIWQFKKFDFLNLQTVQGEKLAIIDSGQYLQKAGPDFFNARLIIGSQKWAGNIEIHLKSSDWYLHGHETDPNYENVILHVVWEHDAEVFRRDNSEIHVLEIKKYVSKTALESYLALSSSKTWIFCEKQIKDIDRFLMANWQERLFFERLERKSVPIQKMLSETGNDWEAVLFYMLAKNFGLNTNGETFLKIARSIPFAVIRKESFELENLEALFFGAAGLLETESEDVYFNGLKFRHGYLSQKYRLEKTYADPVQFFKHRPDNFPTIRISQLMNLYHLKANLFSQLMLADSLSDFY